MADTPTDGAADVTLDTAEAALSTAQHAFTTAEETFTVAETAYNSDKDNEEYKTAFATAQTDLDTHKGAVTSAQTAFDELKSAATKEKEGYWPEDWRDKYVEQQEGLDDAAKEKLLGRLGRYASPQAALDAMLSAQNKIHSGKLVSQLGDNPSKEELSEWRKANNVPESSKDYSLELGDGLVVGDADKEMVESYLEVAHAGNFSQEQVTQGLNWYFEQQEAALDAQTARDAEFKSEAEDTLREEWGTEYKPNLNLLSNFLSTAEDGVAEMITGARLGDGTPLANHPGVLRFLVEKARESNPMSTVVAGSGERAMNSIVDEIASIEKSIGSKEWYADDKLQTRYQKLITARDSQKK